jgi:hypothetical protein
MMPPPMSKNFRVYFWSGMKPGVHKGRAWTFTENNLVKMQKRNLFSARTVADALYSNPIVLGASLAFLAYGTAWTSNMISFASQCFEDTTDDSAPHDFEESTMQSLRSANILFVSVEERRLSIDVSGKSAKELQTQLDKCDERTRKVEKEKDELERLRGEVSLSTGTLEILMREPGVSDAEKQKIRSKLKELGRLEAKLKEKSDQLLNLLLERLYKESAIIEAQLDQLTVNSKK